MTKKTIFKGLSALFSGFILVGAAVSVADLAAQVNNHVSTVEQLAANKLMLKTSDLNNLTNNAWYRKDFTKYANIPTFSHTVTSGLPNSETIDFGSTGLISNKKVAVGRDLKLITQQRFKFNNYLTNFALDNANNFSFNLNNVPTTKTAAVTTYTTIKCESFHPGGLSKGSISFKDEVSAADWLNFADKKNQDNQTKNIDDQNLRTLTFSIDNNKLQILPNEEKQAEGFDWTLIYIIIAASVAAMILIFIICVVRRNVKAKKALNDEDDE